MIAWLNQLYSFVRLRVLFCFLLLPPDWKQMWHFSLRGAFRMKGTENSCYKMKVSLNHNYDGKSTMIVFFVSHSEGNAVCYNGVISFTIRLGYWEVVGTYST